MSAHLIDYVSSSMLSANFSLVAPLSSSSLLADFSPVTFSTANFSPVNLLSSSGLPANFSPVAPPNSCNMLLAGFSLITSLSSSSVVFP